MLKDSRESKFVYQPTISNPECQAETLESLKGSPTKILDKILILFNLHGIVFANQTTLGKNASVGRRQANRLIKKLADAGIIFKKYRANLTSVYYPAPFLLDPKIRQRFSKKFEAFRWLPLILLFSGLFVENVSRTISAVLFIKTDTDKLSNVYRYTDSKRMKKGALGMYTNEAQKKLILELKDKLNLSVLGQIKLLPYPTECLEYVSEQYSRVSNPKDPVKIFTYLCNEWCKANDVRPDWATCYQLYKDLNIDPQGSFYATSKPVSKPKQAYQKREIQRPSAQAKPWSGHDAVKDSVFIAAHKSGDMLTAQGLDGSVEYDRARKESKAPDYANNPVAFRAAVNFARLAPDNIKAEWSQQFDKTPYKFDAPVVHVIKEWRIAQEKPADMIVPEVVKAKTNPFMHVENARMDQQRLDEPPMIDYGSMEEIFEADEVVI